MRTIICITALLLTSCACTTIPTTGESRDVQSYRIYSEDGDFAGRIDRTSRIYDRDGNFIGKIKR